MYDLFPIWHSYLEYRDRDYKPSNKAIKSLKRINQQKERSQVKQALRKGKEIPLFKRHNDWDWS